MTRKICTLAAIVTLTLICGAAFARDGVKVRTADYVGGHHGVAVQEVRHPGHGGYYGGHGYGHHGYGGCYGAPMVYPSYVRPYPVPPMVIVAPRPAPVYVPAPQGSFYYSNPRFSIGLGF